MKDFKHFLKLIKESRIDLNSFYPGETFNFVVKSTVKTDSGDFDVIPESEYTVTGIDEDSALVICTDQNGKEIKFDIDSIFDKVNLTVTEKKTITKTAKPKKGKMHQVLGIDPEKEIKDVYKSGKKLAHDLVDKVGKKKATGMLAFAANINKNDDLFDKALRAVKDTVNEKLVSVYAEGRSKEDTEKLKKFVEDSDFYGEYDPKENVFTFQEDSGDQYELTRKLKNELKKRKINATVEAEAQLHENINKESKAYNLIGSIVDTTSDVNDGSLKVTENIFDSVCEFLADEDIECTEDNILIVLANIYPSEENVNRLINGEGYDISEADFDSWEDVKSCMPGYDEIDESMDIDCGISYFHNIDLEIGDALGFKKLSDFESFVQDHSDEYYQNISMAGYDYDNMETDKNKSDDEVVQFMIKIMKPLADEWMSANGQKLLGEKHDFKYFLSLVKENKNSGGVYKVTNTRDKKPVSKTISVEFTNPTAAIKALNGLGLSSKPNEKISGEVVIDINSKEDKEKTLQYLKKNGYSEVDGYGDEGLKRMFPALF